MKTWAKKTKTEPRGNGFYERNGALDLHFTLQDEELFQILFCGRFYCIPFSRNLAGRGEGKYILTDAKTLSLDHVLAVAVRLDLENVELYSAKHARKIRLIMRGRKKAGVYTEGRSKLVVCRGENITPAIRAECQEWVSSPLGDNWFYAYSEI